MTRKLLLIILASALLSFVLAAFCHFAYPDVIPYAAGEDDAMSWRREMAVFMTATAWISGEVSALFAIVLAAYLWKRRSLRKA
jgi:hypothetical protein